MKPTVRPRFLRPVLLGLLLSACSTPLVHPVTYRARIDHVDIPAGEYLSLEKGAQAMTQLYLRVLPAGRAGDATPLRVSVPGWYDPEKHGGAGDTVTFAYPGPLPRAGKLCFVDLLDYRVATQR